MRCQGAASGEPEADVSRSAFSPPVSTGGLTRHNLLSASRSPLPVPCLRCGFPVVPRPSGCKNPCHNCGFVYPLGDCSD
jgi:hypothetical protein